MLDHRTDEAGVASGNLLEHAAQHHAQDGRRDREAPAFSSSKKRGDLLAGTPSITMTPNIELLMAKLPTMQNSRISGISMGFAGTRRMLLGHLDRHPAQRQHQQLARMKTMNTA
jgi:hypothetical protein